MTEEMQTPEKENLEQEMEQDERDDGVNEDVETSADGEYESGEEGQDEQKLFTQEELDHHIKKRIKQVERKFERKMSRMSESTHSGEQFQNYSETTAPFTGSDIQSQVRNAMAQIEQERAAQIKMREIQDRQRKFDEGVDETISKYDDYEDIIEDAIPLVTEAMSSTLYLLPNGAEFLYRAQKESPDELKRISNLRPEEQVREMILLDSKLKSAPTTNVKSKAPAPVKPVSSAGGGVAIETNPAKMTYKQRVEQLRKQQHRR